LIDEEFQDVILSESGQTDRMPKMVSKEKEFEIEMKEQTKD
jgi:hypothetical protein